MSTRTQDFQRPEVVPNQTQESDYQDEWANRFGILVGGVKETPWNGIGENSVGHHRIVRREWVVFTRLRVGRRPEFEGALDFPENAVQLDWSTNPERLGMKSPRACAGDVLAAFGAQGYCVPKVLVGHANPEAVCEKVWPREARDGFRLIDHIEYFEGFQSGDETEVRLAEELLAKCYECRGYVQEYVRTIKTEVESKFGLKNLNEPLKQLFEEIGEPLPEQKTALVAQAMGREIVKGQGHDDGRKDDAIIGALNAITTRLERIESGTPLVTGPQGADNEGTTDTEIPNTQPRRGPGRPPLNRE